MRLLKQKFFVLMFSLFFLYLFVFYVVIEKLFSRRNGKVINSSVVLHYVVVHLDLKGAPPKLEYLESLLPMFRDYGVNGLLMEYEDMFPYEGKLVNISAKNSYNRNELKQFLIQSMEFGLEIIPLVQTFGHIEHALKLQEFRHLRELPKFPDSICPNRAASIKLIKNMLEQVIKFHLSIAPLKYFHIGCDEVFHMNKCKLCRSKNMTDIDLFYKHVHKVNHIVQQFSPHTTVLIWDDMLRGKNGFKSPNIDLSNIEPVYWDYRPQLSVTHVDLLNYHKKFNNIWIASAFKGADGRVATIPHFKNRFNNNLCWLDFIANYRFGGESDVFNFKGIILTGWSRYSHMDPLCELLPASIPSLMLNLLLIQTMKKGIFLSDTTNLDFDEFYMKYLVTEFQENFKCKDLVYIDEFDSSTCTFDSSDLYNELKKYSVLKSEIEERFSYDDSMLSSIEYYSKRKTLNKNMVQLNVRWCKDALKKLSDLEIKIRKYMSVYYEKDVIDEYVGYKMHDSVSRVWAAWKTLKSYSDTRAWNRRPYYDNDTLS